MDNELREIYAGLAMQALIGHIPASDPKLGQESVLAADNLLAALNESTTKQTAAQEPIPESEIVLTN